MSVVLKLQLYSMYETVCGASSVTACLCVLTVCVIFSFPVILISFL